MLDMFLAILMAINITFGGTVGNIDLDHRIVVENPDGSISTERSLTVGFDDLEVILPTIVEGKMVSEEEAIDHFLSTGEHLGMFPSLQIAELYAELLHLRQEQFYGKEVE